MFVYPTHNRLDEKRNQHRGEKQLQIIVVFYCQSDGAPPNRSTTTTSLICQLQGGETAPPRLERGFSALDGVGFSSDSGIALFESITSFFFFSANTLLIQSFLHSFYQKKPQSTTRIKALSSGFCIREKHLIKVLQTGERNLRAKNKVNKADKKLMLNHRHHTG